MSNNISYIATGLLPHAHKYWHPTIVHFPIAFFCLEALLLIIFFFRRNQFLENASRWLLWLAILSALPVAITGLHDVGIDLEKPGNLFLNGLVDRIQNFTNLDNLLSLHFLFIEVFVLLTVFRLGYRLWLDKTGRLTEQRLFFVILTIINLWILLSAAQAGGGMSHT